MDVNPEHYSPLPIPTILDKTAEATPEKTIYSITKTLDPADGWRDVTYKDLADAVNRAAWWLERKFGKSETFETLAYLAPADIRYSIFVIAAAKVGYQVSSATACACL